MRELYEIRKNMDSYRMVTTSPDSKKRFDLYPTIRILDLYHIMDHES
jgi:hypothetical protein